MMVSDPSRDQSGDAASIKVRNAKQAAILKVHQKGREFVMTIESSCPKGPEKSKAFAFAQQAINWAELAILEGP